MTGAVDELLGDEPSPAVEALSPAEAIAGAVSLLGVVATAGDEVA